jgi:hypothetical protein
MSFTQVFGGNTIYPAQPTYLALDLDEDVVLEWPVEQATTVDVLAAIIDVTPDAGGRTIMLPDAREGSTGYATTFYGAGASTFTVENAAGVTVLTVASGEAWTIYLQDNSTLGGTWNAFEQGAGTSTATAASLAGAGIKAITTTLNQKMDVVPHAVDYVLVNGDRATMQQWTGGLGIFTLPNPATVGADWFVAIKNSGSGSVTLTPTAGTIDGSGTLILSSDESTFLVSDGTNWFTIGLGQEINSVFDFISLNVAGSGDFTLAGAQLNRIAYEFTGVLTGNRNIIVPASVQQYWVDNSTTGAFTLTVKTAAGTGEIVNQGQRRILYCDGVNVISAETFIVSTPVAVTQGGTGLITVAQGDILYGSATDVYSLLAKSALATRYLSNTGASNAPAWAQVNLTNGVTGTLPTTSGGTGLTSYTQGDIIYSNAANSLSVLAKDTNATRYLTNTGSSNNPAWGQVNLANGVSGTLPIGNGGTGQTTANAALNALLPSQTGNGGRVLTTDGTNTSWLSIVPSSTAITLLGNSIGVNAFLLAGSPGGVVNLTFTVGPGVILYSPGVGLPALDLRGFAGGSTINLVNQGYILGYGGRGGIGGAQARVGDSDYSWFGQPGEAGGNAVEGPGAGVTFNIDNSAGFIWGGGGGGGGGGTSANDGEGPCAGGCGGGGAGFGKGGLPNGLANVEGSAITLVAPGADGSFTAGSPSTGGGAASAGVETGSSEGGDGGGGGDWGTAGTAGVSPTGFDKDIAGGAAGAAGKAIDLNGGATGTFTGSGSPNIEGAVS